MAGEAAARSFLDDWQAANLLHTPWDKTVVHVFLLDPGRAPEIADTRGRATASAGDTGGRARVIYHAAVIDVEDDGIWVASYEDTGDDDEPGDTRRDRYTSVRFEDLGPAFDVFAARAERAGDRVERGRVSTVPEVVAGVLRYRTAEARATAARARVGDAVRRAARSPLASPLAASRAAFWRAIGRQVLRSMPAPATSSRHLYTGTARAAAGHPREGHPRAFVRGFGDPPVLMPSFRLSMRQQWFTPFVFSSHT